MKPMAELTTKRKGMCGISSKLTETALFRHVLEILR